MEKITSIIVDDEQDSRETLLNYLGKYCPQVSPLAECANIQEAKAATGGTLSAYQLDSEKTIIKANTGGSAKVIALDSIDASANTGGSIAYKGNPKKVRTKDGLSGSVKGF